MSTNATTTTAATPSYIDIIVSLISIPSIVTQLFLWANLVSFIVGFTGNICSLLTFSRPSLRIISTSCLFMVLAGSDIFFLLIRIIDFVEYGLQIKISYHRFNYDALCRFRMFALCVAQLFSAWILVLIAVDRWIRTKFPFKANSICAPKKVLLGAGILFLVVVGLNAHVLTPYFGMLLPGIPQLACGANSLNYDYLQFFYYQWTIILVCITQTIDSQLTEFRYKIFQIFTASVGPSFIMFVLVIHMIIIVRAQKNAVVPHAQGSTRQEKRNQTQMFILMISNVVIFLITTLPLSMSYVISLHTVATLNDISNSLIAITVLNYIQQLNCSINFYIRCLTSTLFRKEFLKVIGIRRNRGELSMLMTKNQLSVQNRRTHTQH